MKFRITGPGWPVDQWLIPAGTLIDTDGTSGQWSMLIRQRKLPPPITATPLDRGTYNLMVQLYGADRVGPPPSEIK